MTPDEIVKDVEKTFGLPSGTVISRIRSKYVVKAKIEAVRKLRDLGLSSVEMGKFLKKNHTSILNLLKKVSKARRGG